MHHFLPLRSCFILDFSAKCMLGRHGLWFLFRKILCQKLNKLDGKNLIFIFFFVYFAAVCLLPSEFLLQKNFFDMVPGFDQTQVEKMQFLILFHNIYSNYKPRNHEYTNNIFEKNFLSPSWRHGPQKFLPPQRQWSSSVGGTWLNFGWPIRLLLRLFSATQLTDKTPYDDM